MISRCVNVTCNDKNDQIGIVIENDIFLTNMLLCLLQLEVNDLVGKTKRTVIMPLKITNGSEC